MTESFWLEGTVRTCPALSGTLATDTAIVGGGMTGLAVACYASERGIPCVLLERAGIGSGASGRNAGIIITGLGEHYARSIAGFGRQRARQIWELNRRSHQLLRALLSAAEMDADYQRTGSFALAWDPGEAGDLQASVEPLLEDGFPAEILKASEVQRELGLAGCEAALYCPEDAQLHPVRLLQQMANLLHARRVPCFEASPVLGIVGDSNPPGGFRVELPDGTLECRRLVLATNAYTPQLLSAPAGWIEPVRGQCLATPVPEGGRIPAPCYADRGHVYWRSYRDCALFGGFDGLSPESERGYRDEVTPAIQGALEEFASGIFAGELARPKGPWARLSGVSHRWSGVMGYGKDWFPLIGEYPEGSGLYLAAGFTGHGFGYAFQAALWIAQALAGESPKIPGFLAAGRAGGYNPPRRNT